VLPLSVISTPSPGYQARAGRGRRHALGGGLQFGGSGAGERRVGVVGEHLHLALVSDVGRSPDVIGVEVRQDQPPQVCGLVSALADRVDNQRRGPRKTGVDEGVREMGIQEGRPVLGDGARAGGDQGGTGGTRQGRDLNAVKAPWTLIGGLAAARQPAGLEWVRSAGCPNRQDRRLGGSARRPLP
jgi:hypothetical protein